MKSQHESKPLVLGSVKILFPHRLLVIEVAMVKLFMFYVMYSVDHGRSV